MTTSDLVLAGIVLFAATVGTGAAVASKVMGYVAGAAVELELLVIDDRGHQLRVDAARAFIEMRARAAAEGVLLVVNSAFRSMASQETLYEMWLTGTGNLAAKPGWSNHQGGIAVDIESANGTNAAFAWLTRNAAAWGFHRTVPSEPWHWEFSA